MIKEAIAKLVKKENLTAEQMNDVMEEKPLMHRKQHFLQHWQQRERLLTRLQQQPRF